MISFVQQIKDSNKEKIYFLFFINSLTLLRIISSQDLNTLCQTSNILNVVNAFKINDIIVLLINIKGNLYPIKMKDLKFNTEDKSISLSSAEVWNEWSILINGTKADQLKDIFINYLSYTHLILCFFNLIENKIYLL